MIVLAALGVLSICFYFAAMLWQQYQRQELLPINMALLGLGLVNSLSGLAFAIGGLAIGTIAVAVGMISLNLGQWLNETAYEKPPHPNVLGGRVAASFFVTGLVYLLETA